MCLDRLRWQVCFLSLRFFTKANSSLSTSSKVREITPLLCFLICIPVVEVPSGDNWISAKDSNQACRVTCLRQETELIGQNKLLFHRLGKESKSTLKRFNICFTVIALYD